MNDTIAPCLYSDMETFMQKLRAMGYGEVRLVDTAKGVFGSRFRAKAVLPEDSKMLAGRK